MNSGAPRSGGPARPDLKRTLNQPERVAAHADVGNAERADRKRGNSGPGET